MAQQTNQNMQMMNNGEMRFPQQNRMVDETSYSMPPDTMIGGDGWVYENPNPMVGAQPTIMGGGMMMPPSNNGMNQDLSGETMPVQGMNGGGTVSQASSNYEQSQRMKNPLDMETTHWPSNARESYQASLRSLLARNVGYFIVCTFLIGTQQSVTWQGILHTVGSDYLVLYQPDHERYISCDLYSLKFAQFHNLKGIPYCANARAWEGKASW